MEENPKRVTVAADILSGQQVDIELTEANQLWVAVQPGIELADIWLKDVAGIADLRVRIMRLGVALEVSIDRGEQSVKWWPPEDPPRLTIVLDAASGRALATASIGIEETSKGQVDL